MDISFKIVHKAFISEVMAFCSSNGPFEKIKLKGLRLLESKSRPLLLEMCFEVIYRSNWTVNSKYDTIAPLQCEIIKSNTIH